MRGQKDKGPSTLGGLRRRLSSADPAELARAALYERYASTHAGVDADSVAARIAARDVLAVIATLGTPPSRDLLDLGCGQGRLVEMLEALGFAAAGVDRSDEQVAIAQARGLRTIVHGDALEHLARGKRYGVIVATDFLEHLTRMEVIEAWTGVYEALLPGGLFICRVPNASSPFFGHYQYGDLTHETVFTQRSLEQLARHAGFGESKALSVAPLTDSWARRAAFRGSQWLLRAQVAGEVGRLPIILTQNLAFGARK